MIEALIVQLLAEQAKLAQATMATPVGQAEYLSAQGRHAGIQIALDILKGLQDAADK